MAARPQAESLQPRCPGKEKFLKDARDLSPSSFRRLVVRRARKITNEQLPFVEDEDERREQETMIQEKIDLKPDFLPARFLYDGAERSRAVCRIRFAGGLGTGFLIGPGILMTNNHVLESRAMAATATAEFDFEQGGTTTRVAIDPDRLFITDPSLDFTIVACQQEGLEEIEPIRLRRDPASVTRFEPVNIVQHPAGRLKEVALHNNQVERILDKVIRYRTDTEPGSSGSAVFNNQWELVALHHAGQTEPGGRALNEGIRTSAIVAHLIRDRRALPGEETAIDSILEYVDDSSPYLGFFDIAGVAEPDGLEVEVPDFTGNGDFADVGCWNIEHFNDNVPDDRINDVAGVIDRLSLDVCGLTEVQNGALERLVAALAGRGFDTDFVLLDTPGRQDIAILYDRDTTNVELLNLSEKHRSLLNQRTSTGRTIFPRQPLFAKCILEEEDGRTAEFLFIVVHLKAFGDAISRERRRQAAGILSQIIDELRESEELPVVLGGDFNERLDTDVLQAIKDSPDLVTMTADDATLGSLSFIGPRQKSLIDHLVVSNDVMLGDIAGDDAAIVRLDKSVRDFADRISDHVPLVFRMVYRPAPVVAGDVAAHDGELSVNIPSGARRLEFAFDEAAVESAPRRRTRGRRQPRKTRQVSR